MELPKLRIRGLTPRSEAGRMLCIADTHRSRLLYLDVMQPKRHQGYTVFVQSTH